MRILLDSHLLVWISQESPRLPKIVERLLEDGEHRFFFSAASLWELAIKSALGKTDYQVDVMQLYSELLDNEYEELPLSSCHAFALAGLPPIHKDPFDRMLIAQSISEGMLLLTSDETIARYNGTIQLVR
ncbi:type II toxin-antitoxin system VapC family toxin [Neorhizobium galegae]|uniref:type II toxin-antitoxin system VapC family toxin n=1 Tax=Neorhizobium galegae TaxID=399 RepID=UPI0006211989|nr:type II toxin-antitoxin system VapC family toxin [Neorhizobium galegae]MCQ1846614.1 type II toxin-antitoxin system VapC family toxin [Neorhizobium galegae]CDZ35280.1 Pilus retraction motor protein PilT [Neorhizobium galegae bv. officinalis]